MIQAHHLEEGKLLVVGLIYDIIQVSSCYNCCAQLEGFSRVKRWKIKEVRTLPLSRFIPLGIGGAAHLICRNFTGSRESTFHDAVCSAVAASPLNLPSHSRARSCGFAMRQWRSTAQGGHGHNADAAEQVG